MNLTDKEALSALLDNEAGDLELRRILKSIDQDPELLVAWERMNLAQAVLHDELSQYDVEQKLLAKDFSQKVAAAVANETISPATRGGSLNWGQAFTKVGIAASVALAFFLGMQTSVDQSGIQNSVSSQLIEQPDSLTPVLQSQAVLTNESLLADSPIQQVDPQARRRLEEYIRSVSITPDEPVQLEQLQDSPLYRLVNEIKDDQ